MGKHTPTRFLLQTLHIPYFFPRAYVQIMGYSGSSSMYYKEFRGLSRESLCFLVLF